MLVSNIARAALCALCFLGVSAVSYPVAAAPCLEDDCLPSSMRFAQNGMDAPILFDMGTSADANGTGCDGCNIDWDILVVWQHDGTGVSIDWDNSVAEHKVEIGEHTTFVGLDYIGCNSESGFDAAAIVGSSSVWIECQACGGGQ